MSKILRPLLLISLLALTFCAGKEQKSPVASAQSEASKTVTPAVAPGISGLDSTSLAVLAKLVKPEHELNTLLAHNDTITLVLSNRALFFPLGKFSSIQSLEKRYAAGFTHQIRQDSTESGILIDYLQKGANAVRFIWVAKDDEAYEDKTVFIVSGHIVDGTLPLANGVAVGMSKRAFLSKYFSVLPEVLVQRERVVVLASALDGIRHYYTFQDGKLASIRFTSDYVVD